MVKIIASLIFGLSLIFAQPMMKHDNNPPAHCQYAQPMKNICEEECEICLDDIEAVPMPDDPKKPCDPGFEDKKPKEKLEMIRIWKLTEALNLTEDQSTRFFPKLKIMRQIREDFDKNRMRMIEEVEGYLRDAKKYEKELKTKMQEFELNETKFKEAEAKIRKEIASILTPEQQAKFMLFQMRFDEEIRRLIHRAKQMKQDARPKRRPWRLW